MTFPNNFVSKSGMLTFSKCSPTLVSFHFVIYYVIYNIHPLSIFIEWFRIGFRMVVLNVELEAGSIQELALAHMTGDFHMFEKGTFVLIEVLKS